MKHCDTSSRSTPTLRQRVIQAGGWTAFGHAAGQGLRFAGNLVLTRLLFPEAFGLMAIVQSVLLGIGLLSDIGITPSIVQHRRGSESKFLHTAWTFQVIRGFAIALLVAVSAYPLGAFYGEPMLTPLLLAAAAVPAIAGFNSISLGLAERALALKLSRLHVYAST